MKSNENFVPRKAQVDNKPKTEEHVYHVLEPISENENPKKFEQST